MKKKMFIIISISVLIDQFIKYLVRNTLMGIEKTIIPNFFYLTGVKNTGGAFSILESNSLLLAFIGILVVLGIIFYLKDNVNNKNYLPYSLLLGGILGNIIDRIVFNGVYDYIGLIFFSYHYPVFNIADTLIVGGIIILILLEVWGEKDGTRSK